MTNAIDNGTETVTIDTNASDARSMMLASANAIASIVVDVEGKLANTAKAWGHALFRAVYVDKSASLDALIGDSKVAAGWPSLTSSDGGRKAKGRLEVYFSNARLVAERWDGMEATKRDEVTAGTASIHYLADQFRKTDREAKREADKAAKSVPATEVNETPANADPVAFDPHAAIAALSDYFASLTEEQAEMVGPAIAAMMNVYDARINALLDAGEVEAIAA